MNLGMAEPFDVGQVFRSVAVNEVEHQVVLHRQPQPVNVRADKKLVRNGNNLVGTVLENQQQTVIFRAAQFALTACFVRLDLVSEEPRLPVVANREVGQGRSPGVDLVKSQQFASPRKNRAIPDDQGFDKLDGEADHVGQMFSGLGNGLFNLPKFLFLTVDIVA